MHLVLQEQVDEVCKGRSIHSALLAACHLARQTPLQHIEVGVCCGLVTVSKLSGLTTSHSGYRAKGIQAIRVTRRDGSI